MNDLSLPLRLHAMGAIKVDTEKGFRMEIHDREPDRLLSPLYFNLRTSDNPKGGPLTPDIVEEMGRQMWNCAKRLDLRFDGIAGLPNAGIPLADAFLRAAQKEGRDFPVLLMEKEILPDGKRGKMFIRDNGGLDSIIAAEGRNAIILPIDDVVSAGGSKDTGINALEGEGYHVLDVEVLIDRRQGGEEHLARRGIRLRSVYTAPGIMRELHQHSRITGLQCDEVIHYLQSEQFV